MASHLAWRQADYSDLSRRLWSLEFCECAGSEICLGQTPGARIRTAFKVSSHRQVRLLVAFLCALITDCLTVDGKLSSLARCILPNAHQRR